MRPPPGFQPMGRQPVSVRYKGDESNSDVGSRVDIDVVELHGQLLVFFARLDARDAVLHGFTPSVPKYVRDSVKNHDAALLGADRVGGSIRAADKRFVTGNRYLLMAPKICRV